jgi:hypothetical protein
MLVDIVNFEALDGIKLDGYIARGNTPSKKIMIFVHGMQSNCFKEREKAIINKLAQVGIDSLNFNNRGSEVIKAIKSETDRSLGGMAYEDVEKCYDDIVGAINLVLGMGYEDIYLSGHSLGSTKVLYTYNRFMNENSRYLENIKALSLLSLVDIADDISKESKEYLPLAEQMKSEGKELEMMPINSFMHPISVKNFLYYAYQAKDINYVQYMDPNYSYEVLNKIKIPLFMRWGDTNEMIPMPAKDLVELMQFRVHNPYEDINYIEGADHGYFNREQQLANELADFLVKNG